MEQENLIEFIKELMELDTLHQEYQDNDIHFVIDARKDEDNTLNIKVKPIVVDTARKEFEEWLKQVDDELFAEVLEALQEDYDMDKLDEAYSSENYKEVIDIFRNKAKEIATNKINAYKKLF